MSDFVIQRVENGYVIFKRQPFMDGAPRWVASNMREVCELLEKLLEEAERITEK